MSGSCARTLRVLVGRGALDERHVGLERVVFLLRLSQLAPVLLQLHVVVVHGLQGHTEEHESSVGVALEPTKKSQGAMVGQTEI